MKPNRLFFDRDGVGVAGSGAGVERGHGTSYVYPAKDAKKAFNSTSSGLEFVLLS